MKLNLFTRSNDKFFKNILPLPSGEGSCPMETFITLNSQNQVDNIILATYCTGLSMMGYDLPPGTIRTNLYISGASKPTTPSPSYSSSPFIAHAFLTTDSKRLQVNDFITIVQPNMGPAASIAYSTGTTVTGSIEEADVSILGAHFSTSLDFTSSGFSFQKTTQLYGNFTADISGVMTTGTMRSWDDFSLSVSGQFAAGTSGFVSELQSYVYGFTDDAINSARTRASLAESAINSTLDAIAAFNPVISQIQNDHNTIDAAYMEALSDVQAANASLQLAMNAVSGLSPLAHNIYEELMNVCPDQMCMKECASSPFCHAMMKEVYVSEHGIDNVVHLEQLLQHKSVTSMQERWTSDYICRVMTKIKGWGQIAFDQTCSYPYIYEMSSYTYQQAYHTAVNVSRSESAVIANHDTYINEPQCDVDPCGRMMYNIDCIYRRSACSIARTPILNTLNETERAAVWPFITFIVAQQNLTAAVANLTTFEQIRNMSQQEVNDATSIYQRLQNEHTIARNANMSIVAAEMSLLALGSYLEGVTIQNLFTINTISFQTTITDSSPQVLPITIRYTLAGLGPQTVNANAQFTASYAVLKRELAQILLSDIGNVLSHHISKRSVTLPTFNERQFEERCAMVNSVKDYLEQIRSSLITTHSNAVQACANLSSTIESLNNTINYMPTDYPNVNFTYLASMYNVALTPDQLTAIARNEPEIMSIIESTTQLRDYISSMWDKMPIMAASNWMIDMKNAHSTQKISSVAGRTCYSFSDCLNMATFTIWQVLQDTPSAAAQSWSQSLPMARQQLLELALNATLNITLAATRDWPVIGIVNQIISSNYWCSGLPEIPQPLESSIPVEIGDTITIQCTANSNLPLSYSWKKDGFVVAGQSSMTFIKTNANSDDEGQYQCLVTNAVGTVESTFAQVVMYSPPNITLHPMDYETYEGSDNGGYFACNATGHPIPTFMWYFRHQNSTQWVMISNSSNELVIPKPTKADQGWYRCTATASIGQAMSNSAHLSILGASTSKLIYKVHFWMNITSRIPSSGSGAADSTPPPSLTTIDYFRSELNLGKAAIDNLQVGFNQEGDVVQVGVHLSTYYEYMVNETMEVQAPKARMYWSDLNSALMQLEDKVQNRVFWFEVEGSYFETVHQSASVSDLIYWCPDGSVLMYSNFLCSKYIILLVHVHMYYMLCLIAFKFFLQNQHYFNKFNTFPKTKLIWPTNLKYLTLIINTLIIQNIRIHT